MEIVIYHHLIVNNNANNIGQRGDHRHTNIDTKQITRLLHRRDRSSIKNGQQTKTLTVCVCI
jgi:hypothetical protein